MKIIKFNFFILFVLASALIVFLFVEHDSFKYFSSECKILTKEGTLVYSLPNYQRCDFHPDGLVIASTPFSGELRLIDVNDITLWSATEFVHHDLKFTNDKKSILAITSDLTEFQNSTVRSDCVSRRDLSNNVIRKWCLKDHLEELEQLGFRFEKKAIPRDHVITGLSADYEISHANSVYEIGPNSKSKIDPVFSEGNYIINLFVPSLALLILDKNMKNVVWHKKMSEFNYTNNTYSVFGHDYQVTSEGNILAYFNKMKPNHAIYSETFSNIFKINLGVLCCYKFASLFFSRLVEFDPYSDEIYWLYEDTPKESFKSIIHGTVSKLRNSYLYTDITNGGRATEITADGKKVWTYIPKAIDPKTKKPVALTDLRPLPNDSFLKSRSLISD